MAKKPYVVPTIIEYGTLEELTKALSSGGLVNGGLAQQVSLILPSDRNLKHGFTSVDNKQILSRLVELPITAWTYKTENQKVRHIGPMAQDFAASFGLGQDDKHINMVDANGVAFAAIQALYTMMQEKDAQLAELRTELDELKKRNQ
jgi:hypothetical protein